MMNNSETINDEIVENVFNQIVELLENTRLKNNLTSYQTYMMTDQIFSSLMCNHIYTINQSTKDEDLSEQDIFEIYIHQLAEKYDSFLELKKQNHQADLGQIE